MSLRANLADERARAQQDGDELAELTEALATAVLRLDREATITFANRAALGLLPVRSDSLVGRSAISVFVDHRIEDLLSLARERGSAAGELTLGGSADRTVSVRASRAASGATWLLLDDITELRQLRRIRSEFIDNLSHELRTPLTTVRLLTETLSRDLETASVPDRIRERVAKMDVETGHLVQMVNELLDLSRIESGETQLRLEPVDLGRVARSAIERVRTFAERQHVRLEPLLSGTSTPIIVRGDEERLGQLLINLLHNAVKFSPVQGVVAVEAHAYGGEAVVSVVDQGPGIPVSDIERVFERFYKVDRARVRGASGTGLGLSIARHIVEAHGGRIWAESEEGRGSTFRFAIPMAEAPLPR